MARALFLGSTPLTILVRCACRRRIYVERAEWAASRFAVCDNCGSLIEYNSLRVQRFGEDGNCMEDLMPFKETAERKEAMADFDELLARASEMGAKWRERGEREIAHRVLNAAQGVLSQKCLLAQTWHLEDEKKRAA